MREEARPYVDRAPGGYCPEKTRIGVGVRPAQLHRSLDFARDLGERLRALFVLPALAVLNIREF